MYATNLFSSCFNLRLTDKDVDAEYHIEKDKILINCFKILLTIMVLLSYGTSLFLSFYVSFWNSSMAFQGLLISTYFLTFLYTIFAILFVFNKKIRLIKWSYFIMFFSFFIIANSSRFTISRIINNPTIWVFHVILEFIARMVWLFSGMQSFMEVLIINFLSLIVFWAVYVPLVPSSLLSSVVFNGLIYTLMLLSVIGTSYFFERQKKMSFFYHKQADRKAVWLTTVFDKLKAGFLSIRGGKINYINPFLREKLDLLNFLNRKFTNNEGDKLILINNFPEGIYRYF